MDAFSSRCRKPETNEQGDAEEFYMYINLCAINLKALTTTYNTSLNKEIKYAEDQCIAERLSVAAFNWLKKLDRLPSVIAFAFVITSFNGLRNSASPARDVHGLGSRIATTIPSRSRASLECWFNNRLGGASVDLLDAVGGWIVVTLEETVDVAVKQRIRDLEWWRKTRESEPSFLFV
ncbi:hypothetical protein Ddye_030830 [Dipteronia dyeriana]|uniref:Uncharacterized protein n=1 Tax=Dipteronia dyeriana TaxID=168575 RepID=A0AAD9TI49_9ROSI|nr:hypothetical protein Ddye_030830 [Dipteronia dyeriana]